MTQSNKSKKNPPFLPKSLKVGNSSLSCVSLQKLSKIFKSLGFGLGLKTFANFWRILVSVSENLVSGKKSRFRCRTIWFGEKVLASVSLKLVSEKSVRFGFVKFSLGLVKILFCHSVGGDADNDDDQEEDNGHTGSRQAFCCSQSG